MTDKNIPLLNHLDSSVPIEKESKMRVGWREWVQLPELGISAIKAKVDTGARTSCLHTFRIQEYEKNGEKWVKFMIHPIQDDNDSVQECHSKVIDMRIVRDSGGHESFRYVIKTLLIIGECRYPIEITLTARDKMKFRMLLGRTAMEGQLLVDPEASFIVQAPQG